MLLTRSASPLLLLAILSCTASEDPVGSRDRDAETPAQPGVESPRGSAEPIILPGAGDAGAVQDASTSVQLEGTGRDGGSDEPSAAQRPAGCPFAAPVAAPGQAVAVRSLNFLTSEIVLQNVSAAPVTILAREWQWCQFPSYWHVIPEGADVTLQPGESFLFVPELRVPGELLGMRASGEEMGIYDGDGTYNDANRILAYVTWGSGPAVGAGREYVASTAGLWTQGDRVAVTPGAAGILAVGMTDRAEGYEAVLQGCLEYDRTLVLAR